MELTHGKHLLGHLSSGVLHFCFAQMDVLFNCLPCFHLLACFTLILTHLFGFLFSFGSRGLFLRLQGLDNFGVLGAV